MRFFKNKSRFNPLLTALIVIAWIVLMGTLLRDQYLPGSAAEVVESFQIAATESDDWFLIRIGGAYAGFGRSRQIRRGAQWEVRDELNISLNVQGQVKPIKIANQSVVDESFKLVSFHLQVNSGLMTFDQRGRIEGRELVMDIPKYQGGGVRRIKIFDSPRIARSLGLPVPLTGLKVNDEVKLPIFDPLDGQKWDAVVKVLEKSNIELAGVQHEAWRVKAIFRSVEMTMWIDDEGRLLKGRMPLDMTVQRADKAEISREMRSMRELPDIISMTAVPVEGDLSKPDLKQVRLLIQGDKSLMIPDEPPRQTVSDYFVTLKASRLPAASFSLPAKDPKLEQFLGSSRFIRSDHPDIIKKAKEVVGNETDPVKAAGLINSFVHGYLNKTPTPGVPDAYGVLMNKQGDCNEHAVLAVSLARAVGLPSRMVVGLVHMDEGFAYHAWVNYWSGSEWFSGDPLLGTLPIGPLYISLVYGDVDKHVNVISFLGRLRVKVLEAS